MNLPHEMVAILAVFAPLFSERVWRHAQVLLVGALLTQGTRTVTRALRVMGLSHERHWTNYHRVLNRAVWSTLQASKILLGLIVATMPVESTIVLGADDTVERRTGRKIKALGCYRDGVRSTRKHVVRCFGLKWVSMQVLVAVPWSTRVWALPFLSVLCWPKEKSGKRRRHKTGVDLVRQMMCQVRRWLPERMIVLVVDGGFAAVSLALACRKQDVVMVARLRLDAALYHPPALQPSGKRGRKPTKGKRQRSLRMWAARSDTPWEERQVAWYGGGRKRMLVFSRAALWYTPGQKPVEVRFVLVRDPAGKLRDEAFFCTAVEATPQQILTWVVWRWSVEVTFEEARAHLGVETQREWSDKAIARTTPVLLGLFSLVTLLTMEMKKAGEIRVEQTAWYKKEEPTFSDCIALVRRRIWHSRCLVNSGHQAEVIKFPQEAFEQLIQSLPLAA